jgi:hypothetical protein
MSHGVKCSTCGTTLPETTTICPHCGWDLSAVLARPPRQSVLQQLRAGGWRFILYGAILIIPIFGFVRLRTTGPGPDLATTIRWMALGDGGRSAELVSIHRAHEIGAAASRYAVRETEAFGFDDGWGDELAPYATMHIRGWMPLVNFGADSGRAPASVREFYEIRETDGWGRPYRVETRFLERGSDWTDDPDVASDLEKGLSASFFTTGQPEIEDADWLRLVVTSSGADGVLDTDDDLRFTSYSLVSRPLRLVVSQEKIKKELERAYTVGHQFFRVEGSEYDLIDARLLAEYRLTSLH